MDNYKIHEKYMKIAINLAKKGAGKVNPNPMVGAVIVKENKIIGMGYHERYGEAHAEVNAINSATESVENATMYVTLEPCSHYGKTPPCVELIIKNKIKTCIIGMKDPNLLVAGNGILKLKEAGITIIVGILEEKVVKLNSIFIKYIQTKIPYVFLKTAITLDGKIATREGDSKWISNKIAREKVQKLRNKYHSIMIGVNTVLNDDPQLTARIKNGSDPYRIVVDPNLRIKEELNIIKNNYDNKTIIVTSNKNINTEKYNNLLNLGIKFINMDGVKFNIKDIIVEIGKLNIDSILIEGGSYLISKSIEEKVIDKGIIFIAPKIVGDNNAIAFINGREIYKMKESLILKNPRYKKYGNNIAIKFNGVV